MSYQVKFGRLEDLTRLTTKPQRFVLRIESYNRSLTHSPSVPLDEPTWDYNWGFVGSEKQILRFWLLSLDADAYMQVMAMGRLDFRDYVARNNPGSHFRLRIILDSKLNNQVFLHLDCTYRADPHSRNDGLKEVSLVDWEAREKDSWGKTVQVQQPEKKDVLFQGACDSRNFFSFLDPVHKGQTFSFFEPSKK